jgi:error-prone DNA polymerase
MFKHACKTGLEGVVSKVRDGRYGTSRHAQAHRVEIRPICMNASRWDCTLEPTDDDGRFAVRLGMRMVKGLANAHAAAVVAARADQPFRSVDDLWRRAGAPSASLVQLAEADAFRPALGLARREALWAIKALRDEPLPLFAAAAARDDEPVAEIQRAGGDAKADDCRE